MSKIISGVYAAVTTPRHADGSLNESSWQKSIEFLLEKGIRGFALNGATGEYCLTNKAQLQKIISLAKEVFKDEAKFVVGIGSAGIAGCLEHGKVAIEGGANAVLLPMPHFFPYSQDDLTAFCSEVAKKLDIPILLYNLPQFTGNGFSSETAQNLISKYENIIGIKDSSGSLDTLRDLNSKKPESCRILGNDDVLAQALSENIIDGVISGVAGVLPELILSLFKHKPDSEDFKNASVKLNEFIKQLSGFPVPWGLKIFAEARGIAPSSFLQPLSDQRLHQIQAMQKLFKQWEESILTNDFTVKKSIPKLSEKVY